MDRKGAPPAVQAAVGVFLELEFMTDDEPRKTTDRERTVIDVREGGGPGMSWKRICAAADVPANTLKKFDVDGIAVVIANYGDGFRCFPPFCPHMEEPLEQSGLLEGGVLTCSKHLWQWDLRTGAMIGQAERPLLNYEVKRDGNDITANIESELTYEYGDEDDLEDDDFFNAG